MAADTTIASAYAARYTQLQIEEALDRALAEHASGVTMTSVSLGGHTSSGQPNAKVEDIIATLTLALELKKGTRSSAAPDPIASRANLSTCLTEV